MLENIEFDIKLEKPSLDLYDNDWLPAPGLGVGGMWVPGIVTDASGQDYYALRGFSDAIYGMTHTANPFCGFRSLTKDLNQDPPHLYPEYASIDWFEPYTVAKTDDAVTFTFDSGTVTRGGDGSFHWTDATGRWELSGKAISDIFVVHVPVQEGIESEVYYRHELIKTQGTVNGIPVEGFAHQDVAYGPPGTTYSDSPIVRQLEGLWVSWIHEYEDGSLGGACFWQGRDAIEWGPGYLVADGGTTSHGDFKADLSFNDDAKMTGMHVDVAGRTYDFEFSDQTAPLHYVGRLTGDSSGKKIKDSWCFVEYPNGMLTPEILDMMSAKFELVLKR
jgi:hypothetical protein